MQHSCQTFVFKKTMRSHHAAGMRGLATGTALALLTACATPQIGDPSRPVMAPGEGVIATSIVFSTSMPDFMRLGGLLTTYDFEALDGSGRSLSFGLDNTTPRVLAKVPHGPNDTPPVVLLRSLKPGKYRLAAVRVDEGQRWTWRPSVPTEVTVTAGQVTYVGSMAITYTTKWQKIGEKVVGYVWIAGPKDEFARDVSAFKTADERLKDVAIVNALHH